MSRRKTIQDFVREDIIDIVEVLSLALNRSKAVLFSEPNYEPNAKEIAKINDLIQQRQQRRPFAYLNGSQGFYHLDFKVTDDTLIPRPETELLIDIVLELFDSNKPIDMLDLGTGSGIIAVTLADKCPAWWLCATDQSKAALDVAQSNATRNIDFYQGSWYDAVPGKTFDLIISNPPYIETGDVHLNELRFEPMDALVSGKDGLDDIRIIIENAPKHLNGGGYLLLEHGYNQQQEICQLLKQSFTSIKTFKDYNGNDRAVLAQMKLLAKNPKAKD